MLDVGCWPPLGCPVLFRSFQKSLEFRQRPQVLAAASRALGFDQSAQSKDGEEGPYISTFRDFALTSRKPPIPAISPSRSMSPRSVLHVKFRPLQRVWRSQMKGIPEG